MLMNKSMIPIFVFRKHDWMQTNWFEKVQMILVHSIMGGEDKEKLIATCFDLKMQITTKRYSLNGLNR